MKLGLLALAGGALIALLLAMGLPAHADDSGAVALDLDSNAPALAERLRAELASLGFKVVEVKASEHLPLDVVARRAGAVAVIRTAKASAGVEIWVADRVTGRTLLRQISAEPSGASILPADVALQAVELLRASLLELSSVRPDRGEVARPARLEAKPAEAKASRPSSHRFGFSLGPGILLSQGGVPASGQGVLQLDGGFSARVQARVVASLALSSSQISGNEGSANISTSLAGAGIDVHLLQPAARWQTQAGAGLCLLWLQMQGLGSPPLIGKAADVLSVAPYLRFGLSLRVTGVLLVALDSLGGYTLAQPVMNFAGREIAAFGRPFALLALGVRLEWP